jgi:hypothetical protein
MRNCGGKHLLSFLLLKTLRWIQLFVKNCGEGATGHYRLETRYFRRVFGR